MRWLFLSLFVFFAAGPVAARGPRFVETVHDFGTVERADGRVEHGFEFVNGGDEPVVITKVSAGCVCVRVSYDKRPVAIGGRGVVSVIYDAAKHPRPGRGGRGGEDARPEFYRVVEVYSSAGPDPVLLVVKGVVR